METIHQFCIKMLGRCSTQEMNLTIILRKWISLQVKKYPSWFKTNGSWHPKVGQSTPLAVGNGLISIPLFRFTEDSSIHSFDTWYLYYSENGFFVLFMAVGKGFPAELLVTFH